MIEYEVTSDDLRLIHQKDQQVYAKVQLLNKFTLSTIAEIDGIITDGTITIDASSITRKSASLTLYITDDFVGIGKNKMIWFDKYVKLYIGLKDCRTDAIKYYSMGLFIFDPVTFSYSATTNNLTLSLADLMSQFDAEKDGIIGGYNKLVIPAFKQDENGNPTDVPNTIRESLIDVITTYGGIKSYIVEDIGTYITKDYTIPYDLEFDVGSSVLDVITKLRDLYPGYEAFFDSNGVFICRQSAIENNDPIYINYDEFKNYITSDGETVSVDINAVKNVIEVWGKDIYYDRYTEFCNETDSVELTDGLCTISQEDIDEINNNPSCYHVICEDTEEPVAGTYYAIKVSNDNRYGQTIKIQVDTDEEHYFSNLTAYPIWDEFTNDYIEEGKLRADNVYVFLFKDEKFYYYGSFTAHGVAVLSSSVLNNETKQNFYDRFQTDNILFVENNSTQFGVEQIGVRLAESSSETTSNIDSDSLALSQAEYELYQRSRFSDTISLNTILIPWLNVNTKVQYQGKNDIFDLVTMSDEEKERKLTYVVNKIDMDIKSFTMNVELSHFYSLYQTEPSKYNIKNGYLSFYSSCENYYLIKKVSSGYGMFFVCSSSGSQITTKFKVSEDKEKLYAGYISSSAYHRPTDDLRNGYSMRGLVTIPMVSCGKDWSDEYINSLKAPIEQNTIAEYKQYEEPWDSMLHTTFVVDDKISNLLLDENNALLNVDSPEDYTVTFIEENGVNYLRIEYRDGSGFTTYNYLVADSDIGLQMYTTPLGFCIENESDAKLIKGIPIFETFEDVKEYWLTGDSSKCINNF